MEPRLGLSRTVRSAPLIRRFSDFPEVMTVLYLILGFSGSFAQNAPSLAKDSKPGVLVAQSPMGHPVETKFGIENTVWHSNDERITGFRKVAAGPDCLSEANSLAIIQGNKVKVLLEMPNRPNSSTAKGASAAKGTSAIKISQSFSLVALICPQEEGASITRATIDATMPEHQHGMNYKPKMQLEAGLGDQGSGIRRLTAQGMVFHMPGKWQIELQIFGKDRDNQPWPSPERLRYEYILH